MFCDPRDGTSRDHATSLPPPQQAAVVKFNPVNPITVEINRQRLKGRPLRAQTRFDYQLVSEDPHVESNCFLSNAAALTVVTEAQAEVAPIGIPAKPGDEGHTRRGDGWRGVSRPSDGLPTTE